MTSPTDADDLATYAADDALIDALADRTCWGQWDGDADPVAELLASWRGELDDVVVAAGEPALGVDLPGRTRQARLRRHTAAAAAVVVTLAASTGVAAAASGANGPFGGLHRVLFGAPPAPARIDAVAGEVTSMLDSASSRIAAAVLAGGVTDAQRASIGQQLDAAGRLLAGDATAPSTLASRLADLRAQLGRLSDLPSPANSQPAGHRQTGVTDHHGGGSGQQTSSDATSGQQSGDGGGGSSSDGTDGSSSGSGSGDATGGDSGGTSDSSSGSGSNDGSSTSDGGSSDSGSTTSDGSSTGSGSGSDSGSTSGSDPGSSDSGSSDPTASGSGSDGSP